MSTPLAPLLLHGSMETLLIPLWGRAQMSRAGLFSDPDAEETVARLPYDFERLRIQKKTQVFMTLRAALLDRLTLHFLQQHPAGTVLALGSGLDARRCRLARQGATASHWYELDLPPVMALRQELSPIPSQPPQPGALHYLATSVTDPAWTQGLAFTPPVLVLAEGLLMYLRPEEVAELLTRLAATFPGALLACDVYSPLTLRQMSRHQSLRQTQAQVHWALASGPQGQAALEALCPGAKRLETLFLTDAPQVQRLDPFYRALFRLAGAFSAAREAHRIEVLALPGSPE